MNEPSANPIWVGIFFVVRCVIPILLLVGVSYLLKKLGLVADSPIPPSDDADTNGNTTNGGLTHGSA